VQTAIDLYSQQLAARADQQLRTLLPTLSQWEQTSAGDGPRLADIQRLRESVVLQAGQSSTVPVVQPPTADSHSAHPGLLGAVLGAFLGGAVFPLGVMAWRRRSGRVWSAKDVAAAVDGVLVPVVELREPPPRPSVHEHKARTARTLYAQCCSTDSTQTILVIAASSSSGSAAVSSLLELAAAEAGSVQVVTVGPQDVEIPDIAQTDDHHTVIVDAGVVGSSWLMPALVAKATTIVEVARLEADTVTQVLTMRAATKPGGARRLMALTYQPWWPSWFATRAKRSDRRAEQAATEVEQEGPGT
jgi:hypothetical protein